MKKPAYKEAMSMCRLLRKHGFVMDYIPSKSEFDRPPIKSQKVIKRTSPSHPFRGKVSWVNMETIDPDGTIH